MRSEKKRGRGTGEKRRGWEESRVHPVVVWYSTSVRITVVVWCVIATTCMHVYSVLTHHCCPFLCPFVSPVSPVHSPVHSPIQELDILQREMSAEAEDHDFQLTIMKQEGEQLGVENAAYVQG